MGNGWGFPMLRRLCIIAPLLLAACVSQSEKDDARKAWGDCVMAAVIRLDDGSITENSQASMRALMRSEEGRLITTAILTHRAGQRGGRQ